MLQAPSSAANVCGRRSQMHAWPAGCPAACRLEVMPRWSTAGPPPPPFTAPQHEQLLCPQHQPVPRPAVGARQRDVWGGPGADRGAGGGVCEASGGRRCGTARARAAPACPCLQAAELSRPRGCCFESRQAGRQAAASFLPPGRGLQGAHPRYLQAGATCKHLAAYSLEEWGGATRHEFDARLDPRWAVTAGSRAAG